MCTVTWLLQHNGLELFCNRDELRTRQPARPPARYRCGQTSYLAPVDGDAGGSWLAVNEHGLALCLLNFYPDWPCPTPRRPISRGRLVVDLMDTRRPTELAARLQAGDLSGYSPFLLLGFGIDETPAQFGWDGSRLTISSSPDPPLTTSSFDAPTVEQCRRERFAQMAAETGRVNAAMLRRYHHSTDPRGGAYSVCLSREDAQTVSFSHVRLSPRQIEFHYAPRAPDGIGFGERVTTILPR